MIYTAYIDEGDTHGKTPDIVMSAILGNSRQWELFLRRIKSLQQEYNFSIFHGTEFRRQVGEFSDWSEQKGRRFLHELGDLVRDTLTEGVTVSLKHSVYKEHFLDARPVKMHQTSQYGLCFAATLDVLEKTVLNHGRNHRLSVVIESGHKNASDTKRLFGERKEKYALMGLKFLNSHKLLNKKECSPLMVADFMAHGSALKGRAEKRGYSQVSQQDDLPPRPKQIGWTVAEVNAAYLRSLIEAYQNEKAEVHAEYLRRKAARVALIAETES